MVFQMPQYWDVAIDGIQIMLCFLILVFIIRSRKKNRKSAPDKVIRDSGQSFNEQIFTQTLRQQVDQAFANIAETIAVEQGKLDRLLPISEPGRQAYGILQCQSDLISPVESGTSQTAAEATGSDPLHEQIQKLALKGMSARQISEDLKTPLGEVELVLSIGSNL